MRTLYFDGSSSPHFGNRASYGYVLDSGIHIEHTDLVPEGLEQTNNVAEYMGLIEGLKKAITMGVSSLEIIGDSQLILYQVMGRYKCKAKHLKPLHAEVMTLLGLMPDYKIRWVKRDENLADEISRIK